MANFTLSDNSQKTDKNTLIFAIDGSKIATWSAFYATMQKGFSMPDYFENNLDSLDECLNDLEWVEQENVVLVFEHFEQFLSKEKSEQKLRSLLNLLDATAEDWKWVEDETAKKNFSIVINDCSRIKEILNEEEIVYA